MAQRERKPRPRSNAKSGRTCVAAGPQDSFVFAFERLAASARSSSTEQFRESLVELGTLTRAAVAAAVDLLISIIRVIVAAWASDVDDYCGTRRRFSLLELE